MKSGAVAAVALMAGFGAVLSGIPQSKPIVLCFGAVVTGQGQTIRNAIIVVRK